VAHKEHYLLQFFTYAHLREDLKATSISFARLAAEMDESLPENPEKTTALRKLLEAKDCAVRARLFNTTD
jgi:ferritin-like protein